MNWTCQQTLIYILQLNLIFVHVPTRLIEYFERWYLENMFLSHNEFTYTLSVISDDVLWPISATKTMFCLQYKQYEENCSFFGRTRRYFKYQTTRYMLPLFNTDLIQIIIQTLSYGGHLECGHLMAAILDVAIWQKHAGIFFWEGHVD